MNAKAAPDDRLPPHLVRAALLSGFGSLLLNLSSTTLNVALNALIGDLHTTLDAAQWTITGYLLALTLVLPLFRWAAERAGMKRLYLACLVGFSVTSGLCAAAWSIESLIAFRVLQGLVGGLLSPIAQALAAQHAGPARMGRMVSIVAIPVLAAPLLGPVVGGVLVEKLSWHWIFLLNVPLGLVCAALCARYLPADDPAVIRRVRLDATGLALLSPGMAILIYGITTVRHGAQVGAAVTVLPFLVAAVLIALFVRHARRGPERALIDLRLFQNRVVAAGLVTYVLAGVVSFGGQLLLPLYLQQVRGEGPMSAGLWLAPQGLGMILTLSSVGRLTDRYDPGKLVIGGVALTLLGTLVFVRPFEHVPDWVLAAFLVVRGAGLGATNLPGMAAVYRQVPKREVANATAALNIVQRMGAPLGTAIMAVVLQWRLGAAPSRAHAFAETFSASVLFSALTVVSALFLVGARAPDDAAAPPEPEPRRS
jgi:EmrB/QacA subfamily drug resistance transporter